MRRNFTTWLSIVLTWQLASFIFTAIGMAYFQTMTGVTGMQPPSMDDPFYVYSNSHIPFVEGALFGLFFGSFFFVIHWITENTRLKKQAFGRIVMIQSLLYFISFIIVFSLTAGIMINLGFAPFENSNDLLQIFIEYPVLIYAFLGYISIVVIVLNFLVEVSKKFGPGNLWNLFIGKYHNPIVEDKIFMFIDLKDSTGYAEKLGHIQYSKLIQSCFLDLNSIVSKHNGQIYQYVGDEAVLMWDKNENGAAKDCIELYYGFRELLHSKSENYKKKYGLVPEFKAGINDGSVTAAEVGNIKREIAFHGDVLNTASRIQKVCSQYKKNLLASESFVELLDEVDQFRKILIGYIPLKGKSIPINIYSIEEG